MCLQSCFSPDIPGSVCGYTHPPLYGPRQMQGLPVLAARGPQSRCRASRPLPNRETQPHIPHTCTHHVHTPPTEPYTPTADEPPLMPPTRTLAWHSTPPPPRAGAASKIITVIAIPKFGTSMERATFPAAEGLASRLPSKGTKCFMFLTDRLKTATGLVFSTVLYPAPEASGSFLRNHAHPGTGLSTSLTPAEASPPGPHSVRPRTASVQTHSRSAPVRLVCSQDSRARQVHRDPSVLCPRSPESSLDFAVDNVWGMKDPFPDGCLLRGFQMSPEDKSLCPVSAAAMLQTAGHPSATACSPHGKKSVTPSH